MDTTSPSKKMARVNNQENRMIREKNCNMYCPKHVMHVISKGNNT